jgi:hypothetical protein
MNEDIELKVGIGNVVRVKEKSSALPVRGASGLLRKLSAKGILGGCRNAYLWVIVGA